MTRGTKKALLLLGAGLLGIAVMTVIILSQREERGFMVRECTTGEGITSTVTWSRSSIPVPVYLSKTDEVLVPDVEHAVTFWKPYLHYGGTYEELRAPKGNVVLIESMVAGDETFHGKAHLMWNPRCQIQKVEVKIPMPMLEGKVRKCVVTHELGHALGLDHDDDEDSVMKGTRGPLFRCEMGDGDAALLKRAYSASVGTATVSLGMPTVHDDWHLSSR